jgi:CubicO group peptidase (beta-lactamase class C family)
MKRISRATFLTAAGATLAACSHPSTLPAPVNTSGTLSLDATASRTNVVAQVQNLIDRYIETSHRNGRPHVGVVIGIVTPEAPHARLLFGGNLVMAADHRRPLPLNGDTPFEIGSITKTFASTIFLRRRRSYEGLLGEFFAERLLPTRLARIPIIDLVNYSPGLPTDNHAPIWWAGVINTTSVEELVATLAGKTFLPQCDPGVHFSYSNFGWGLVGLAAIGVDSVQQRPLDRWQHEIAKLGRDLGFSSSTTPAGPASRFVLPAGYSPTGLLPESETYFREGWNTMFGGGDLVSTGEDMYKWLLFNMGRLNPDRTFLEKQQRPTFTWRTNQPHVPPSQHGCVTGNTNHDVITGAAWFHHSLIDPAVTYLWKDGGVAGFTSWMGFKTWIDTARPSDTGVIVLTNQAAAADRLGAAALGILLHQRAGSPPPDSGDEFEGF